MSQSYNEAMGTLGELLKNDKQRGLAFDPEIHPPLEEGEPTEQGLYDAIMDDWSQREHDMEVDATVEMICHPELYSSEELEELPNMTKECGVMFFESNEDAFDSLQREGLNLKMESPELGR